MDWTKEPDLCFDPAVQQKALLQAWERFIKTGEMDNFIVPSHVSESWGRSRALGIDPLRISPSAYMDREEYEKRKAEHQYLSNIARPFLENIYKYLEQSRYVVALYDPEGYHLIRLGQRADFQRASQFAIREGLCFAEDVLGTTGFGLAKRGGKPIQIVGCEHYHSFLHYVVGSYAPIYDPIRKNLIGVVAIAGARTLPTPHTLALATSASISIESSLRLARGKKVFLLYGKALQSTIDNLDDGIVVVDSKGKIFEINTYAREIFGLKKEDVNRKDISEILKNPDLENMIRNILGNQDKEATEIDIQICDQLYLVSARFARDEANKEIQGVIVHLKNVKDMSRQFNQVVGDQTQSSLESMVGSSKKSKEVKGLAEIAARSDASVIIEGESGTGKEVLAHVIHTLSPRVNQPLVIINCSAIPSELMETTLFGHEKGAFTGAIHTHIGKFELGDKGTIFLDEIGEMPLTMQAKLLRVLEESSIERVGGKKTIKISIRVIAATNCDLGEEVRKGRFREDLFYRLNVFRFILPPLRERKEEIKDLVPFFVQQMLLLYNKKVKSISEDYYRALMEYNWPGNIRELKNAVKFSMTMLDGPILMERHILGFFKAVAGRTWAEPDKEIGVDPALSRLSDLENIAIKRALDQASGNKSNAAKILGISRATLHRRLREI